MTATETITFEPPGPGDWMLDTTHHGRRPLTRFMQPVAELSFDQGMTQLFRKYGLPLDRARMRWVHGCGYIRIMAIGEPEKPSNPPPAFVMKLISRLHPEMRRRTKTASNALQNRTWRQDVDAWFNRDRGQVTQANLTFQNVDVATLDDASLIDHITDLVAHLNQCAVDAFVYHGGDIVPVGLYVAACAESGITAAEAASLLQGASPATMEADRHLAPVAAAIAASPATPASVEEIRSLGPDIAAAVDEWLNTHGWRLLTSDDIDAPTLIERPDLQLRALLSAKANRRTPAAPDPSDLRSRVPQDQRAQFTELLAEARYGLRLRDDQVGIRWNWPAGLLRRALLEVGRRLTERGHAYDRDHALELRQEEVTAALAGTGPTAEDLTDRRTFRDAVEAAGPPDGFSSGFDTEPPFDALPRPMATMARGVFSLIQAMEGSDQLEPLTGTGIGNQVFTGRACVVTSHLDAFDTVEPGDVLVVPYTSPSYNSLFPIVGAVVTAEGGPMSHAAIMAREFGLPAVIGASGATNLPNRAMIELNPTTGTVRLVER